MAAQNIEVRVLQNAGQEKPVVELWCEDGHWGSVMDVNGTLYFELVPRPDGEPWRFAPEAVEAALEQARRALEGNGEGGAGGEPAERKEAS